MEFQTIKTDLHKIIDNIQDEQLLKAVYEILKRQDSNTNIVGYRPDGSPITQKQYIAELEEASARVKAGKYTTHEEFEKEMEQWENER